MSDVWSKENQLFIAIGIVLLGELDEKIFDVGLGKISV